MLGYSMLYPEMTTTRRYLLQDGMWKFQLDGSEVGEKEEWKNGLPNPDYIPVPASFQDFYTEKEIREFVGDFWYEKEVFVPSEWRGMKIIVRFGSATHRAEVFFNSQKVTEHEGGFLPFCADVTDLVSYDQYNTLVVKVNNELTETNIPCGKTIVLKNGKKMAKPYFDFFNYSGIQRSVHLLAIPQESIFDIETDYKIIGQNAEVSYKITTTGTNQVKVALHDASGNCVAESEGKEGTLLVEEARLWKVRDAYLYDLIVQIQDADHKILDEYKQPIGIRTIEVQGTKILVNNESVYLKGFGKHEDSDIMGRGFHPGIMKRDFELMKWIGANSFRTSHYPYSEEIYQMADREGFLIIDEVPAVGLFESLMNFVEATTGKQTNFFEKETTPILLKAHKRAIEEMITRDKNHPCVIAWSLLNEPETMNEAAVSYFKEVFDTARECDLQKRPRTFAMVANSSPSECKCYQFSDFISLNRYYGWYIKGGYEISDALELLKEEMKEWESKGLNKPFIFTEYGTDTLAAEHKLPSVMWSQEYQNEYIKATHEIFDSFDFVKGEQIWNFADFQTIEGINRVDGNKKGIFTRQRQPKASAFCLKQRWENLSKDFKN